jgi:hypothetical protein
MRAKPTGSLRINPTDPKALEFLRPAFGELQTRARYKVGHNSRNEDLARLALRHHTRCGVNRNAANIRASHLNFAGVGPARKDRPTCRAAGPRDRV